MPRLALLLVLAMSAVMLPIEESRANCVDSDDDLALVSQMVAASALSPSAPHPILGRVVVAAGDQIYLRELGSLAAIGSPLTLSATVENTPNPVRMNDNSYAAFVVQQDGTVARLDPEGATPTLDWQTDLRRSGCPDDSLSATPLVHLRRYASETFQARYATDLVYVATRYDRDCDAGNTANRVYALDANTGSPLWVFNAEGGESMDVAHEAPALDYEADRLLVGTDRSAGTSQHSLWSIDVITGAKAWSTGVGPMYASPLVHEERVYVATLSGEIKALSKSDGATLWSVSNGGVPITSNIFREFRRPFGELIAAVDYQGRVWLVRDDNNYGSTAWIASLRDPSTGLPAKAVSRAAIDPGNAKLYVGADDGQIYQLNLVDGSSEATRLVSTGSPVGGASFVFEGTDVNMVAGSSSGVLAKFCAPWSAEAPSSPLQANCTSDAQCDPGNPNPTPCSSWACRSGVCVAQPSADGASCVDDGNSNTSGDECNAGICLGYSSCQLDPGACSCTDSQGTLVTRSLQLSQDSCATSPPAGSGIDAASWCGQEVSSVVAHSSCLAHGTGARTLVRVQLFDQDRRPFVISPATGSVSMSLSGGAGTPPRFLSPTNFAPLTGTSASLSDGALVASPERDGTYWAYLGAQGELSTPSGSTPWTIEVSAQLSNGNACVDTLGNGQVLSTTITMGHVDSQPCTLDQNGFLRVHVTENGGEAHDQAPVRVGYGTATLFAQTFAESILGLPSGASNTTTNSLGLAEFIDLGSYLNGPTLVSATCPGGSIGDDSTVSVMANTANVEIALQCSPAGHVTYMSGGAIRRIEAVDGAVPVNLSTQLNALSSGSDVYPAVSRNGQWMTINTSRFGCGGWDCLAIINSDVSAFSRPNPSGVGLIHPEGRTAISNDGNTIVYFDGGPHAQDLYASHNIAGTWSSPVLLTAGSPHEYNNQAVLSADGTRALFDCGPTPYGQEGTGICEVAIDGTGFQQWVDPFDNPIGAGNSSFAARHADYAPDNSIVFEADWAAEQIWRLSSVGATPTRVIPLHSNDNSPCVLPSGDVASLWLPTGPHELTITSSDGSSSVIITPGVDVADIGMSCHQ